MQPLYIKIFKNIEYISTQKCYDCIYADKNDYIYGYVTCEPQNEDFKIDHACNLTENDFKYLKKLLNKS